MGRVHFQLVSCKSIHLSRPSIHNSQDSDCLLTYETMVNPAYLPKCSPLITTSRPFSRIGFGYFGVTHSRERHSKVLYFLRRILSRPSIDIMKALSSFALYFPPSATTLIPTFTSRGSNKAYSGSTRWDGGVDRTCARVGRV